MGVVINFPRHKPHRCDKERCFVCEGGLFACTRCGCAEGATTTDCCGTALNGDVLNAIYAGNIDYRDGKWRRESVWDNHRRAR